MKRSPSTQTYDRKDFCQKYSEDDELKSIVQIEEGKPVDIFVLYNLTI